MQLTHFIASLALFRVASAVGHGCIVGHSSLQTYSQADALQNIKDHLEYYSALHNTTEPYEYIRGQSKVQSPPTLHLTL